MVEPIGDLGLVVGAAVAVALSQHYRRLNVRTWWVVVAFGLLAVAAVERSNIHDRVAVKIAGQAAWIPSAGHLSDAFLLMLWMGGAWSLLELRRSPGLDTRVVGTLGLAGTLLGIAGLMDAGFMQDLPGAGPHAEEMLEATGEVLVAVALGVQYMVVRRERSA